MAPARRRAIATVGDLHANSTVGLMPPEFRTDAGNTITPNAAQAWLWACWLDYCKTLGQYELDAIIVNGDVPNGINARDAQVLTPNEADQIAFGVAVLEPLLAKRRCPVYMIRGTGYHSGGAGSREELIASAVGAEPDETGHYSRWSLWLQWRQKLVYATHHISHAVVYPYTPLARAMREAKVRSVAGWPLPDIDLRSHVHHHNAIQDNEGRWIATLPAWQLSTEFGHKVAPADLPSIGGLIWWLDDEGEIQVKRKLYKLPLPQIAKLKHRPAR